MLTAAQLPILKADILADPVLNAQPQNADGAFAIAAAYNLTASPVFTVWRTNVPITQVGDNIDGTELAGLTTANVSRLDVVISLSPAGVNPSLEDRRQFFNDIFSGAGGAVTRPLLLALWKRLAWRGERLYATGPGTDATPGLLVFEGAITYQDVLQARAV